MQSYAGKYVPAISYYIHKSNPTAKVKINLVGMAIGDGLCDPEMVRVACESSRFSSQSVEKQLISLFLHPGHMLLLLKGFGRDSSC